MNRWRITCAAKSANGIAQRTMRVSYSVLKMSGRSAAFLVGSNWLAAQHASERALESSAFALGANFERLRDSNRLISVSCFD